MRVTINWNKTLANHPEFELHLPCSIDPDFKYQWFEREAYYYGENDAFVSFYAYPGPGNGYAGITIPITTLDGSYRALKGPYSGNVAFVNRHQLWQRYPGSQSPVVSIVSVESRFRRVNRHCTLNFIQQLCPSDVFIVCHNDEYLPSISPEEVKKPDV